MVILEINFAANRALDELIVNFEILGLDPKENVHPLSQCLQNIVPLSSIHSKNGRGYVVTLPWTHTMVVLSNKWREEDYCYQSKKDIRQQLQHYRVIQLCGAEEACWAHNSKVLGSKPSGATIFVLLSSTNGKPYR